MPDIKHFDPEATLGTLLRVFWRKGAASTGIQDIVTAAGISRSSLYGTYGDKRQLYLAAIERYLDERSRPMFSRLASDERGLPAIVEFFRQLIEARCSGEHAGWGCMIANAHAADDGCDPDVRRVLNAHHEELRAAICSALARTGVGSGGDLDAIAETLCLLAYGVNLRSRAGADATELWAAVSGALTALTDRKEE